MKTIKFMLADKQYIYILPKDMEKDYCAVCIECDIFYVDENEGLKIKFGNTEVDSFYGIFGFKGSEELLKNKLFFDVNVRKDPGFEYNQYCQDIIKKSDVVDKYFFCSNSHKDDDLLYTSWFYNDKNGNIIFEISPFYPWFNVENPQNNVGFVTYEAFMKNYKVVIHKMISKKIFLQWLQQAKLYNPYKNS